MSKTEFDLEGIEIHWCPGCGNYLELKIMKETLSELGIKPKNFEMFLYVNHVLQAEGIKTAIEAQRRSMPHCMGSLYWQINDCWPVASWSGIDYYGKWKALHYFVKEAFELVLVSPVVKNKKIKVFIVSDKLEDIPAKLQILIKNFNGNRSRICYTL